MSDISLARLSNFFSSVSGVDKGYRFVVYFLKIIAVNLTETRGKDSPIVQNINALVNPLADTRMILRFFGLIPILDSLTKRQSDQVVKSDAEKLLAFIEKAQNWAMMVYYPAEHIYWLGAHKVIPIENPDKWSRLSCRAWAVWIVLDVVIALYQYNELMEKSSQKNVKELKKTKEDLTYRLVCLFADFPLAIHWSLESYPLSEGLVGVFGLASTVSSILYKWKYTM